MQGPAVGPGRAAPKTRWHVVLTVVGYLLALAALALVISLTYLVFLLFSGVAASAARDYAVSDAARNLALAGRVLGYSLWAVAVLVLVRYYQREEATYGVIIGGAVTYFALPYLVSLALPMADFSSPGSLAGGLVLLFRSQGLALVVLGAFRLVVGRIVRVSILGPHARALALEEGAEPESARPSLLRRCWELAYCKGALRSRCPRYVSRRTCWKQGSGCYCDQRLAKSLLATAKGLAGDEVAGQLQRVERSERGSASLTTGGPAAAAQAARKALAHQARHPLARGASLRSPCGECPLYLDHQRHKCRVLSWLAYPATAAIIAALNPFVRAGYRWAERGLEQLVSHFSTFPTYTAWQAIPGEVPVHPVSAEWVVVVLLGLLLLSYVLQLTEYCLFRLKW